MNDFNSIFKDVKDSFAGIGIGSKLPNQNPADVPPGQHTDYAVQPPQSLAAARVKRYQDSYRVAKTLNSFGVLTKTVGLIGGGVLACISFISGMGLINEASRSPFGGGGAGLLGGIVFIGGIGLGVLIAAVFFAFGVVISALGQNLFATLDTAVHTSPFLTDDQKAQATS